MYTKVYISLDPPVYIPVEPGQCTPLASIAYLDRYIAAV
jgi:hypothetical protein